MASSVAAIIDHTLLRADATREDILQLCREALQHGFATVCINPFWVPLAAAELRSSSVRVCTVIGFPLGASLTATKRAESQQVLAAGATEVDMVLSIGALRSGDEAAVQQDIEAVAQASHAAGAIVKVILETALLTNGQKETACRLAKQAGADFVKTSTGFGPSGATAEDVALLRHCVGSEMGVKASGGVRSLEILRTMVAAGATRIGTSSGVQIVEAAAA